MIIIDNLSKLSFYLLLPLSKSGICIYYHKSKLKLNENVGHLKPIVFNQKELSCINSLRSYDYGDHKVLEKYAKKYINERVIKYFKKEFKQVSNINEKLTLGFISSLALNNIGSMYIFAELILKGKKNEKLYIVHTNLYQYMCKSNGSYTNRKVINIYLPLDDMANISKSAWKLVETIRGKIIRKRKIKIATNKLSNAHKARPKSKTALVVHQSLSFTSLYKKSHYFSNEPSSPLHFANVELYSLRHIEAVQHNGLRREVITLEKKISLKDILSLISCLIFTLTRIRSIEELYGVIYISIMLFKYKSWINCFKDSDLSNLIYDYDILFPKSLSIALETLGIKTIALQERGASSFSYYYGVIVDTYLYGGSIYAQHGEENNAIQSRDSYNFGMWRVSLFFDNSLVSFNKISFLKETNQLPSDFDYKITILGFFLISDNNLPYTNSRALEDMIGLIREVSENFSNAAIILRMKTLSEEDAGYILERCKFIKNFFLCNDYENTSASYRLCKESDLIISVQTSLAEEALAYGKKVIFINNLYPISDMCKDTYPADFHFCIANDMDELNTLAKDCLINKDDINKKYNLLKGKVSGNIDLSKDNNIAKSLEKFLKPYRLDRVKNLR
ncbi:hypothetical protein [Prochlorococcus sp. MIT 0601]|uniref:hypothetical protein n=1 Tax=Prochlorococcus sp. MIT 0601 TaxID=1499498 RepID=UPI000533B42E|nr:hypothetical protein [Prochlorococcus sp. MIT 0601]KGG12986.1 hypothetical protein EV05_0659 [Prochlorococcus sp. MIT 0601]